jgi:hypothetical protein
MNRLVAAWRRASPRDRRAVTLGLGLALAAWLALRVVPWAVRRAGTWQERAAAVQRGLVAAQEAIALVPLARDSLAARGQHLVAWAPRLFAGASTSEAQADLAAWVSGLAAQRRVRIVRQDVGRDSTASVFTRLTLRVEAEGDLRGVAGWLAALESGERLVRVSTLRLDAPDAATAAARTERLRVEVVLTAWAASATRPAS